MHVYTDIDPVTRTLAHLFPQHVRGCHVNWIFASPPEWTAENPEPEYSDREKAALARAQDWWAGDGRGYLAIQGSKVGKDKTVR